MENVRALPTDLDLPGGFKSFPALISFDIETLTAKIE